MGVRRCIPRHGLPAFSSRFVFKTGAVKLGRWTDGNIEKRRNVRTCFVARILRIECQESAKGLQLCQQEISPILLRNALKNKQNSLRVCPWKDTLQSRHIAEQPGLPGTRCFFSSTLWLCGGERVVLSPSYVHSLVGKRAGWRDGVKWGCHRSLTAAAPLHTTVRNPQKKTVGAHLTKSRCLYNLGLSPTKG